MASPQNPAVTRRRLSLLQGAYYLLSGAWPLVSMRSFELVTGRKRDRWLVRTVGLLSLAFGVLLVRASHRGAADPGLGVAPAAAFGASRLWYRLRGVVNASDLLDAAAEAAFLAGWMRASRGSTEEPWSGGGPGD